MDKAFGDPLSGRAERPQASAPAAAPAPAAPAPPAPIPSAVARSPLDDLSGFAGLFDEGPAAGGPVPGANRGPLEQLGEEFRLPPRSEGLESGIRDSIQPQPGIDLGADDTRTSAGGIGSSDTVALPGGDGQNPFGVPLGRIDTRRPTPREEFQDDAPFGDNPVEGKKQTFYPMLEFGQDFRGLDDEGGAGDPRADSLPPLPTRRRNDAPAKPARPVPRTQAMQAMDFGGEMTGNAPPVSFDTGMETPSLQRDASKPFDVEDGEAGLLGMAMNRRASGNRPAVSDEDVARMKFDLVGDLARKSQPRTPYDSYLFGSLFFFMALLSSVVGLAAWKNGGTFDFSDPQRMIAIARGEVVAPAAAGGEVSSLGTVVVGDALVEAHTATSEALFAVSSATVGRLLTDGGAQLVLVEGVLTNRTDGTLRDMRIDVALVDVQGGTVASQSAVVGTEVTAGELSSMADAAALRTAMEQAALRVSDFELQPAQSTRFSAVFYPGESELTGLIPVIQPRSASTNAYPAFSTITINGALPIEASADPAAGNEAVEGSADAAEEVTEGSGGLRVPAPVMEQEGSSATP
jgi:hypothetical protein